MDILAVLVDGIVSAKKCILISPVTFAVTLLLIFDMLLWKVFPPS